VTVTTVPSSPSTIGTLSTNGAQSLSLNTWGTVTNSSPTNGGKTISGYRARLFPGSLSSATGDLVVPGTTVWNSLTGGNSYYAQGYAFNANGESGPSPSSNTQAAPLGPPVIFSAPNATASTTNKTIAVYAGSWTNSPYSYTYQLRLVSNNAVVGTEASNSNTYTFQDTMGYTIQYSTSYYVTVTASNGIPSAPANSNNVNTIAAPVAPSVPRFLFSTKVPDPGTGGSLGWTAPATGTFPMTVAWSVILLYAGPIASGSTTVYSPSDSLTAYTTGSGGTYKIQASAYNNAGTSTTVESAYTYFTYVAPPDFIEPPDFTEPPPPDFTEPPDFEVTPPSFSISGPFP
jgi:hypothetical protein